MGRVVLLDRLTRLELELVDVQWIFGYHKNPHREKIQGKGITLLNSMERSSYIASTKFKHFQTNYNILNYRKQLRAQKGRI